MARFLVVDDDHSTVRGLTRLLSDDGHHVTPLTSGAKALDALSRESFDAIVTGLEMQRVDGHAVVRATRESHPHACLIVVTAEAEDEEKRLVDAGACIIADKPLDYIEVTRSISECHARGGPGPNGRCHMRSNLRGPQVVKLRRK